MELSEFEACEICFAKSWGPAYKGPIRDGKFGQSRPEATIARCGNCGALRLEESFCLDEEAYETSAYREHLGQEGDIDAYRREHDKLQAFSLEAIWPESLRGARVVDVGCAGGSFLDHVSGIAEHLVAIEPAWQYHESLKERGYKVYRYAREAAAEWRGRTDFLTSFQVIEHVRDPRAFLEEARPLLASGGTFLLSTPNHRDVLMDLLPEVFPAFFYRTAHRWYFDVNSLTRCAELAGFHVESVHFVHRYGLSNALYWLRDRCPKGWQRLPHMNSLIDAIWNRYLENEGLSDTLYLKLKKSKS